MWKIFCASLLFLVVLAGCSKDSSPTRTPTSCSDGTVEWNGHCYEAVLAPGLTWDEAKAACEARGGHLATITSAAENAFVFSLVSSDSTFWFIDGYGNGLGPWLGGFQPDGVAGPNDGWRWVTGEPFTYTNWEEGQPGDLGAIDQNRLRFFKADGLIGDRWDDCEPVNPVEHRLGYIFESE